MGEWLGSSEAVHVHDMYLIYSNGLSSEQWAVSSGQLVSACVFILYPLSLK